MDGGRFLVQLLRIVCGFVFSLIACGLFLAWGFFQAAHPDQDPVAFATMVGTGLVSASVIGAAALFPAAAAIILAELARIKGFVFHIAAGGIIAFVLWTFGSPADAAGPRPGSSVVLAAGFLAGSVYWIIAGRCSGNWRSNAASDNRG